MECGDDWPKMKEDYDSKKKGPPNFVGWDCSYPLQVLQSFAAVCLKFAKDSY